MKSESITLEPGQFAAVCTGSRDAAKVRRDFFRKLRSGGCKVTYVSKDPSDMWLMKEAPVSFAAPAASKIKKTIPQSIRSSADVIVTPQGGGGVYETFRVIELAKGAFQNLRRCANYLAASNIARLLVVTVSSFAKGIKPGSPTALLIWGLLLDLAVAVVALRRDPPWNMISVDKKAHTLQNSIKDFGYAAAVGAAWGFILLASPAALSVYTTASGKITDGTVGSLVFVSALFSVPVVGGELMTNGSIFKRSKRRSRAIPSLFALSALLAAAFAFIPSFAKIISGETLTLKRFALALAPALALLVALESIKFATRKKPAVKETENNN